MQDPLTRASVRQTAGGPANGMSCAEFCSSGGVLLTSGATCIGYVVPANKTFFITDINATSNTGTVALAQLKANAIVLAEAFILNTSPWDMQGIESQMTVGGGQTLTLVFGTANATTATYNIAGYLQ